MRHIFILILIFPLLIISQKSKLPEDVKWVTQSEEYVELCKQIYTNAWEKIEQNIYNNDHQLNMKNIVIVMDLDETVLDNSMYQINLNDKSESFSYKSWNKFVNEEISGLVPGSKSFIKKYKAIDNAKNNIHK